jgi:hypothetical protein
MKEQRWSRDELVTQVRAFERELRAAGLSKHTVSTYVGRVDTFVRWLQGNYKPVGPNSASAKPVANRATEGQILLNKLAHSLSANQISRILASYAEITAYDASLSNLYAKTGGNTPDLSIAADRTSVIEWLRGWGCRHLRRSDTVKTSKALAAWWAKWAPCLPGKPVTITQLTPNDLDTIALAYEELRTCKAASRSLRDRDVEVLFGPTAAAKTLFVVRPNACLPWDDPIRLAFGLNEGAGPAYAEFVDRASTAVGTLASRLGIKVQQLPIRLNRPHSTPAKIIDEYLWVKITRGL